MDDRGLHISLNATLHPLPNIKNSSNSHAEHSSIVTQQHDYYVSVEYVCHSGAAVITALLLIGFSNTLLFYSVLLAVGIGLKTNNGGFHNFTAGGESEEGTIAISLFLI